MVPYRRRLARVFWGGLLVLVLGSAALHAQEGARLEAEQPRPSEDATLNKMRVGDLPLKPSDAPLLEKKAKYLVYRVTWPENQVKSVEGYNTTLGRNLSDIYLDFERSLPDYKRIQAKEAVKAEKQKKFVEEFSKHLVPCIDKVLKQGNTIARINAAMMLAKLGEYGHEEIADPLVAMLEDQTQIDAAKYWGARGLRLLLENAEKVREERELRCIQALLALIHRPPNLPAKPEREDLGGFYVVRRAFIAALGAAHRPAIVQSRKVVAQPALHLVRIVSMDGFTVLPIINERVEAAVGLGQLQQKLYDGYQADYAAYHVGHMLIDFFAAYNFERQAESLVKRDPWRVHAAKLQQALRNMAADSKNAYVHDLQTRADGLLEQVIKNEAVSPKPFADWLEANPPKSKSLYKNDPKAVVNLPKTAS